MDEKKTALEVQSAPASEPRVERLPAVIAQHPVWYSNALDWPRARRWPLTVVIAMLGVLLAATGFWWLTRQPPVPEGIAYGNGRLEADPIDIATKFAGRVRELRVDEGAVVKAGDIVAIMDTRDLEATLMKARAQVEQAGKVVNEAVANVDHARSQVVFARQEMQRAERLVEQGWTTRENFDQRRQQLDAAEASELAAQARKIQAEHALDAAQHDVEYLTVNIADNTLRAPRDGRIEYRISNVGEVLPAGGKVFTMLDTGYVYMDVFLPTMDASRIKIGADARIVLDAFPDRPVPAHVTFIADKAQFTPKMVETHTEREKLMFRVRVRVDAELARRHADAVRSGLPGVGYVKVDQELAWPARLKGNY